MWGLFSTRLQWATSKFRTDPLFWATVYRFTQACPKDPQEAMEALELAACFLSDRPEDRAAPGVPPIGVPSTTKYDVLDHWLDWQRHLARETSVLVERRGCVLVQGGPRRFVYCGQLANPYEHNSPMHLDRSLLQVQASRPELVNVAREDNLPEVVRQTVAVMPARRAAQMPLVLPDGFYVQPVEDRAGVEAYRGVTSLAYQESYGKEAAWVDMWMNEKTILFHANVRAWIVYDHKDKPVRTITGFVSRGIVGAHAGAAHPDVRGRHFSEPLLATVATWGYALGANTLAGVCMPQAVPILARIGATTIDEYITYRRG